MPEASLISNSIATLLGACIAAAALGLNARVHCRAQEWKRKEYVASLIRNMKDEDRLSANAFLMLDWSVRQITLPIGEGGAMKNVRIDDNKIAASLIPHDWVPPPHFDPVSASIRDSFDRLFDYFTELEIMIQHKMIKFEDIRPYLEYYVLTIVKNRETIKRRSEAMCAIRIFIYHYHYNYTRDFIRRFLPRERRHPIRGIIYLWRMICHYLVGFMNRCLFQRQSDAIEPNCEEVSRVQEEYGQGKYDRYQKI